MKKRASTCMRAGLIQCADCPGITLNQPTASRLRFKRGDFLCLASADHCTQIVREIKSIKALTQARSNYVYLDAESLELLQVGLDERLQVWGSDLWLECP